ncbi:MAG: type 4b pilus protein PilO2 [Defluviicoccus sp.]|nr:type 4b pilus protein PilO2 [Defluviicoccus sp.]MDE0278880.1 type 4b pilus protein PilO2 [Defluviicoccus sp.]
MSALTIGGRRFAVGLDWMPRGNVVQTANEARKQNSAWCVHRERETGYAGASEEHDAGMPSLAAAVADAIGGDRWTALVAADDGRCALVLFSEGMILADGDRVFASAPDALRAVANSDARGWAAHATPGLIEGAKKIDASGLATEAVLRPAPLSGITRGRLTQAAAALAVMGLLAGVWFNKDRILLLVMGPPETAKTEKEEEPRIRATIDSAALVAACREGIRRFTPGMPGWKLAGLGCAARFSDSKLVAVRPALKGKPVLVVRWRMGRGAGESLRRRVAERHLAEWKSGARPGEIEGSVIGREAWVAVALPPVIVEADAGRIPSRLALRASLDRRFGLRASRVEHGRQGGGTRIVMRESLGRIGALIEGVRGFEVTRLAEGGGGWTIEGRRAKPVRMRLSRFEQLRSFLQ